MSNDVTGKGASLRELIADKIAKAVNEQLAACGSHRMVWAGDDVPFRYSAEILALTHPTEPPSAGREGWKQEVERIASFLETSVMDDFCLAGHSSDLGDDANLAATELRALAAAPSPEPQPSVRLDREEKP